LLDFDMEKYLQFEIQVIDVLQKATKENVQNWISGNGIK
jgi:hypothetical protein